MSDFTELVLAKNNLMDSLGDKASLYLQHMKLWFQMKWTKEDFDSEVRKIMTSDQMKMHNKLLLHLFKISDGLAATPVSPIPSTPVVPATSSSSNPAKRFKLSSSSSSSSSSSGKRKSHSSHGSNGTSANNESINYEMMADDVKQHRSSVPGKYETEEPEPVRYAAQELFLPDEAFLYGRLLHCAWEHQMDAAETAAAQLLSLAVEHFLKNVLSAVLSQRSGYKVREGKFIHQMGLPVPNPWLRSMLKLNDPEPVTRGSVAELEGGMHMIRPSVPQIEQQAAYSIASAKESVSCASLTFDDIIDGLKTNRSAIQSHTVYAFNMERLFSINSHPSWEDFGE